VMALNVWGMPAKVGSEDKELRIKAIGEKIALAEYDVYLLAELWMRPDHATIEASLPEGYHMSAYGDFALPTCDGRMLPSFCSGLAIVSKFPFIEKQFHEFNYHGDILKPDGEYFARKGAGRARVEPYPGTVVDFFVTHTCAVGPDYTNAYYRTRQVGKVLNLGFMFGFFSSVYVWLFLISLCLAFSHQFMFGFFSSVYVWLFLIR